MAKLEQLVEDHIEANDKANARNDAAHEKLFDMLNQSMSFQHKLRWSIGVGSTMLGIIFMLVYHYIPWIWDMLPKHGHTH